MQRLFSCLVLVVLICAEGTVDFNKILLYNHDVPPGPFSARNVQVVHPKLYEIAKQHRQNVHSSLYFDKSVKFYIIELDALTLELNSNRDFITGTRMEWIGGNGDVEQKNTTDCDYRIGVVRGIWSSSRVAVTVCDTEIMGYIQLENAVLLIQPLAMNQSNAGAHVIYEGKKI